MHQGTIVVLDAGLALASAAVSLQYQLPLADRIVYATARRGCASLWTQDIEFESLPRVRFYAK